MVETAQAIKVFGAAEGAAGIRVIERIGTNVVTDPRFGAVAFFGVLKRGPVDVPIPVNSRQMYDLIFGDPRDPRWHLDSSGAHLTPDAIDGFFTMASGSGQIWVTRLGLEGKGKSASMVLRNRFGTEVLKVTAANMGRWGGYDASIPESDVVVATSRTFTIIAPGIEANEFIDAEVQFSGSPNKYGIVANTASDPHTGEAIFTISSQYDLAASGISGPIAIRGTASYSKVAQITGTIGFPTDAPLTGTSTINETVVTGTGTQFDTELSVGQSIYYQGEARTVTSISSATTLTIDSAFSNDATNVTLLQDNLTVTGSGTSFTTELTPGSQLYVTIDGRSQGRTVDTISSDTTLTLTSGFTAALPANTRASTDNFYVNATNANLGEDLVVGDRVIDPNRTGDIVTVEAIDAAHTPPRFRIDKPFSQDFNSAQLIKRQQSATITLSAPAGAGLSVEIGLGTRFPATHFSFTVKFNGSVVFSIPDASLDRNDALYVEPLVNDSNVAYRTGSQNYQSWVTVENLFNGLYTTAATNDVRPCNGSGTVVGVTQGRVYVDGDFDYDAAQGAPLFPNPYTQARNSVRIKGAKAPVQLEGTVSSNGATVTGTGTNFLSSVSRSDYLYDPVSKTARKVRTINSDTTITLESAFPSNLSAGSQLSVAGYLQMDRGLDMTRISQVGDRFKISFPEKLVGGYDGDTGTLVPYHFTKFLNSDSNTLEAAVFGKNQGLIRIACPGISDISVQSQGLNYASQKAFEYRVEIPSYYTSAAAAEAFINEDLGRNDYASVAFPSYGYIANPVLAGDRLIPNSGDIMGLESYYCTIHSGYHYPAAGVDARLTRFIKLPYEPTPNEEALLNLSGIQPIKHVAGSIVVFGARCPALSDIYTFLHVRRIQSNYVRVFLEARNLMANLFKPNQPELADQIIMSLENYARQEYRRGIFNRYLTFDQSIRVSAQSSYSTGQSFTASDAKDVSVAIVNGNLHIYWSYFPVGILEKLYINCGPDILVSGYGQANSF